MQQNTSANNSLLRFAYEIGSKNIKDITLYGEYYRQGWELRFHVFADNFVFDNSDWSVDEIGTPAQLSSLPVYLRLLNDLAVCPVCNSLQPSYSDAKGNLHCLICDQKHRKFVDKSDSPVVYWLSSDGGLFHKIGWSRFSGQKRVSEIKTGASQPIFVQTQIAVDTIEHAKRLEYVIHNILSEYRSHGEWFSCESAKVRGVLSSLVG